MSVIKKGLGKIPQILASPVSIFIYLFLFFYLVIFAVLGLIIPELSTLTPSDNIQLILGNYTNVLSALGASLAAGSGVVTHASLKRMHQKHDSLEESVKQLHEKIDQLLKSR